jgi:hypothetical protein
MLKWALRAGGAAMMLGLAVAAAITGNRALTIAAAGVPAVFGAAYMAVAYGQRHSYG